MTPAGRSWLQPATTLMALTGILLAGAAAGSAPVDRPDPPDTATEVPLGIVVTCGSSRSIGRTSGFASPRWGTPVRSPSSRIRSGPGGCRG
jgi:hypothetical protein